MLDLKGLKGYGSMKDDPLTIELYKGSIEDMEDDILGDYQNYVDSTAAAYIVDYPLAYPALGLAGECGETVERIKKICRKGPGQVWTPEDRDYLILELGDILWYVTRISNILDIELDEVIERNIEKLNARRAAS